MKTIYLTGQSNFGNRGCEALVRSTVSTLRAELPDIRFLLPSADISRDAAQWPEARDHGIEFVPAPAVPHSYVRRGRLCRFLPSMRSRPWPSLGSLPHLEEHLQRADAVISIGGDNYSLDYGLTSLFFFVGIAERALELGKKVALWGASVGPFAEHPPVERLMREHLRRLHLVSVRETHSHRYLGSLGVTRNVVQVTDSAFLLGRQQVDLEPFWPRDAGAGVLGLNVSPLIAKFFVSSGRTDSVQRIVAEHIKWVLAETGLSVLLIPHVAPLNGEGGNNDELFLAEVAAMLPGHGGRLGVVPSGMNACQLKYVIGHCRLFIGARTHATIAALSGGVPTVSIAYSVKARGINHDLFGHENYVLPTARLSVVTLEQSLRRLLREEQAIRQQLSSKMPQWARMGRESAAVFSERLRERGLQNA